MKLIKLSIVALSLSVLVGCGKRKEDPKPPVITGLSTTSGNANASITITGANFSTTPASNTVKFGDTPATVTGATATSLTVTVPNGSTKGKVSVKVGSFTEAVSTDEFRTSSFIDSRDSKEYPLVYIGDQIWFKKNLNYDVPNVTTDICYQSNASLCDEGRFYDFETATTVCPQGWRLPAETDFNTLLTSQGSTPAEQYAKLKVGGSSGFDIVLTGVGAVSGRGVRTGLWTSTASSETLARALFADESPFSFNLIPGNKLSTVCVRCMK
ncbi:MAG: IPT/TIG domain-containing protein [Raineya sp.]|jgi:uncharacterized protein (TIGR02145 family)|nr:IPT/TIG domain-containing protein [Raineya sp.]